MHIIRYILNQDTKKVLIGILLLIIFSSCHSEKLVSEVIKNDFYDAIEDYILSKKEYEQFLLIPANKFITEREDVCGYLIGPLYPEILELMETDVLILEKFTSNQIVYYTTDFKDLFVERKYDLKGIMDSVFYYKSHGVDIYDRNPLINFLKRSRLLYYNNQLIINFQPDTLFLPQIKYSDGNHFNTDFEER